MADDSENIEELPDSETTCSICYAEFLDPEDLRVHISQVHVTSEYTEDTEDTEYSKQCQFCPVTYQDLVKYAIHIRDVHVSQLKCCKYCTKAFIDFQKLKKHEVKHHNHVKKSTYVCSQCKQSFTNIFDLEQHEYNKHNNDVDGIMLQDYYSIFSSALNIKAPTFLNSLRTNNVYICVKCKYTTPNLNDYIVHLQESNCQVTVCDKCSNVYQDRKGLLKHVSASKSCQNYLREDEKERACPKCHRPISTVLFAQHLMYCKPVSCSVCKILFHSVQELSDHQSKEHPLAISLTSCQFCRREFVGTIALEKHINRTHKGDFHLYKYACVYCDQMYFKHPKDLFGHFFSKHPDIQPYSCKICDKTFRVRKRFTIHIKLDHKSVGFVEFDERYHVYFTDKKSENPFQPTSLLLDKYGNAEEAEDQTEAEQMDETDAEQVDQTDKETDVETSAKQEVSEAERKPFKLRFKEQNKADNKLANLNSDFMTATETEGNQTENEVSLLVKRKRKMKTHNKKPVKLAKKAISETENEALTEAQQSDASDDEPLVNIKRKIKKSTKSFRGTWNMKNKRGISHTDKINKKRFTCNICKKYCYTYQNYNHHLSLHTKNEVKKCIKCSKEFRSKSALEKHIDSQHKSSKLTETLKNLLQRRKMGDKFVPQQTMAEKFQKTIKKVKMPTNPNNVATLTELKEKLPVQKFIEEFTPETNEATKKVPLEITGMISIKQLQHAVRKPSVIKMTKFIPKHEDSVVRLAMPVRYKQIVSKETNNVSVKIVQKPIINSSTYNDEEQEQNDNYDDNYQEASYLEYEEEIDDNQDKNEGVPEVAQEVMLEGTEEPKTTQIPHKIVLPKLPKGYKQIRIAHLLPEAPFFKIVKVDDVLEHNKKKAETEEEDTEDVQLPAGTKLVNVNPLAHLLGDTPVEKVIGPPKKKYYKPKTNNFEKAIAKALLQLENPAAFTRKKTSKKKSLEVEQ